MCKDTDKNVVFTGISKIVGLAVTIGCLTFVQEGAERLGGEVFGR